MGKQKAPSHPSNMSPKMKDTLAYMIREGKPFYRERNLPIMHEDSLQKMEKKYLVIKELLPDGFVVTEFGKAWGKRYLKC
jgi:hypothetical protein